MLRITKVIDDGSRITLRLEGQLAADWVAEFETECRVALAQHARVRLDFTDVTFVDRRGASALERLACDKLDIVNCPGLIRELLESRRPD